MLGLRDKLARSTVSVVLHFRAGCQALLMLDNCEHLVEVTTELVLRLVYACPGVRALATNHEPFRLTGEVHWRVPALSVSDEAVELFCDRAAGGCGRISTLPKPTRPL
ncbi:hypothetical protein [Mycobacterium uberis]|uniref:hypothetical protein n=1 Tax=Mycobacterium uberis TaxID=2162698 RepID=UPI000E305500|nr:hypothetical protein [Mycobacterium uberis]